MDHSFGVRVCLSDDELSAASVVSKEGFPAEVAIPCEDRAGVDDDTALPLVPPFPGVWLGLPGGSNTSDAARCERRDI